jgi:hypothetical protein
VGPGDASGRSGADRRVHLFGEGLYVSEDAGESWRKIAREFGEDSRRGLAAGVIVSLRSVSGSAPLERAGAAALTPDQRRTSCVKRARLAFWAPGRRGGGDV